MVPPFAVNRCKIEKLYNDNLTAGSLKRREIRDWIEQRCSKDVAKMRLEEYGDVFVDIYNNLFLGGKVIVKESELISLPTRTYTRKIDGNLRRGMRDIRKENQFGNRFRLICGLENQTGIDNTMPVRVMGYDYADYEEQIKRIEYENEKDGYPAGAKRIHKNQKLYPVATGVLYYGTTEWKTPKTLYDMLEFPEGMEDELKELVANYPIHVVQVARLTEEERNRLTSDFRLVAEYLKILKKDRKKRRGGECVNLRNI